MMPISMREAPNARLAKFATKNLGVPAEATSLEAFQTARTFELVSMIQVIAHLVDVRESLRVTSDVTKSGSLLLIETWNWRSWTARAFGKSWHEYSLPSVLRWFSPAELETLAGQFGFRKLAKADPASQLPARMPNLCSLTKCETGNSPQR